MGWKEDPFFLGIAETFKQSPFWNLLGFQLHHLEAGEVQLKLDIREELFNAASNVHGGAYASILDTTMGMTVRTVTEGSPAVTVNLNVNFLKAVNQGTILSVGKIINLGGGLVTVEAQLFDDNQTCISHATGIFKWMKRKG